MKSAVLILPYFGKFPDIFPLFLKTAAKNPNINFLIISDSEENIDYPGNVIVLSQTFSELRELMEKRLHLTVGENWLKTEVGSFLIIHMTDCS